MAGRERGLDPILSVRGLTKSYHAVEALRGVDLDVAPAEIHAICGDNGAGKSTLVKLISGAELPDAGSIVLDGRACAFASPQDALAAGIATIYQELAVAPKMAVYQNIFLGSELVRRIAGVRVLDRRAMIARSRAFLGELSASFEDMTIPVEELSGGQRQAVAISRALRWEARLVILDEPTAALGVRETQTVLDLIRRLRDRGTAIVLVSHNMQDVVAVADRVSVLRTGRNQIVLPTAGLDADALAHIVLSGQTD